MALTDQVIMPGSDYQAICDATRELTGKTGTLKSGDVSTELGTVKLEHTTVVFPALSAFPTTFNSFPINIKFKCNGVEYTSIEQESVLLPAHSKNLIYKNSSNSVSAYNSTQKWVLEEYRKITILETVDESLLKIFDEANALYYTGDYAAQPTKEVLLNNGDVGRYWNVAADKPYDSLQELRINAQGISTGVNLPLTLVSTQTINDGVITFSSSTDYKLLIAKVSSNRIQFAAFNSNGSITNIGSSDASADFLISQEYAVRTPSGGTYTYTWTVATSSSSDFYENTIEIYGA